MLKQTLSLAATGILLTVWGVELDQYYPDDDDYPAEDEEYDFDDHYDTTMKQVQNMLKQRLAEK